MRAERTTIWASLGLLLSLTACGGGGSTSGEEAGRIELVNDRLVVSPGLRPQLSPDGTRVAYDYLYTPTGGGASFYAVRVVGVDGVGDTCLTCNHPDVPRNAGAPAFHPNGSRLAFTLEKGVHAAVTGSAGDPGGGLFNDLAVYDLDTDDVTVLYVVGNGITPSPNGSAGVLHPHFSHDGTMITWADLIGGPSGAGEIFGRFRIGHADYVESPGPMLANVRYIEVVGAKLVVVSGFSPDGTKVYVQCKSVSGQYDHEMDVCEVDVATGESVRILRTSGQVVDGTAEMPAYEEHVAPIPSATDPLSVHSIVAFSSLVQGVDRNSPGLLDWVATDLWSFEPSGTAPERLTNYNVSGSAQSDGFRAVVSKLGTDEGGSRLVYSIWKVGSELTSSDDTFQIRVADLVRN